jgi:mRNA-degrading endonuclease RelE of RelBE toxin-antitoxin system
MKYSFTERFIRSYRDFPADIQKKFDKQLGHLLINLKHPSLHTKKYDETTGIWQARVDRSIRFYFLIENGIYVLLDISKHKK